MSDSSERHQSRADDPDWIKGLVAQALIKASETEPEGVATPDSAPEPAKDSGTVDPTVTENRVGQLPDPPQMGSEESFDRPLIIGREHSEDTTASSTERPVEQAPERRIRELRSERVQSPRADLVTEREYKSPTVAVAERPEPLGASVATADGADHSTEPAEALMESEEVTTEGFRSSDIRTVLEWLAVIVSALVVALIIKGFVLQAFYIPSESMETTVNEGDRILVNKVSYRLHDVRRGDLVVFKKVPGTTSQTDDLIKRAIALPGETIEVRSDGRIWIWAPGETAEEAKRLEEPYLDPQNELLQSPDSSMALTQDVWHQNCANQPRTPGRCTLGENQYFMMGDNRNSSSDSRTFGPVTEDLIVGRAFLRIWPLGEFSPL